FRRKHSERRHRRLGAGRVPAGGAATSLPLTPAGAKYQFPSRKRLIRSWLYRLSDNASAPNSPAPVQLLFTFDHLCDDCRELFFHIAFESFLRHHPCREPRRDELEPVHKLRATSVRAKRHQRLLATHLTLDLPGFDGGLRIHHDLAHTRVRKAERTEFCSSVLLYRELIFARLDNIAFTKMRHPSSHVRKIGQHLPGNRLAHRGKDVDGHDISLTVVRDVDAAHG